MEISSHVWLNSSNFRLIRKQKRHGLEESNALGCVQDTAACIGVNETQWAWMEKNLTSKWNFPTLEDYQLGQRETNYATSVLIFKSAHVVSPIKYAALFKLLNKCKFPKGIFRLCCDCVSWCFLCSLSSLLFDDSDQMDDTPSAENQPGKMINFTYTVVFISDSFSIFVCLFAGVSDWSLWQATGNFGEVLVFDLKKYFDRV